MIGCMDRKQVGSFNESLSLGDACEYVKLM